MKVVLAGTAGFCFGVERAVSMTEKALQDGPMFSLGELIHNSDVVKRLSEMGLTVSPDTEDVPPGSRVVIRSHGISRHEFEALAEKDCDIIDATCPKVSRIHKIVSRAAEEGRQVVIFGEPAHPEVRGICGWCVPPRRR